MSRWTTLRSCWGLVSARNVSAEFGEMAHEILHALEQLDEDLARLGLRQLLLHYDPIEQFALGCQFEHQVYAIHLVKCVLQAQHVWMTDTHQHGNLLLQTFHFTPLAGSTPLLELLHRERCAVRFACREVDGREVTLAQLAFDPVLLQEAVRISVPRVPEDEARLIQHRDLVAIIQLAPLVSAHNSVIDVRAVPAQILQHRSGVAVLVLVEEQAVSVAHRGNVDLPIALRMPAKKVAF